MDIAAMSVALKNNQIRLAANMAVMNQTKQLAELQGNQLVEMLEKATVAPHPTSGKMIDVTV